MSSSFLPSFRPRRPRLSAKGRFRAVSGKGTAPATRDVITQKSTGRSWGARTKPLTVPTTVSRASATTVGTQLGRSRPPRKSQQSRALVNIPKKSVQVNTVNEMVRAYTKKFTQIYQALNEGESQVGFNKLVNVANQGEKPLHLYCLNTLDRPLSATILGDAYPLFKLNGDASFIHDSTIPVVFGNNDVSKSIGEDTNDLLCSGVKVKIQFYGRIHKPTTYTVKIIRFKKPYQHMLPYFGAEESVSTAGLQSSQIQERKAMWIDGLLRPHTVNPCVITGYALPKVKSMFEVVYSKKVKIDEILTDADDNNRDLVTISIPYNRMMSYNLEMDTRYAQRTDAERTDAALNTSTVDIIDLVHSSKPKHYQSLWLMITADVPATQTEDVLTSPGNVNYDEKRVASYDISFRTDYKFIQNVS